MSMKLAFIASSTQKAQAALAELEKRYGHHEAASADCIVALGGDGLVLKALYTAMALGKPVFAMRRTDSVGFMCNDYAEENLSPRIEAAQKVMLHPLRSETTDLNGTKSSALAINEVTLIRECSQSAKLRICVDGVERIQTYSGDGLLVSTPAGSTAYNHSCGGPIMPLDANTLVMTAVCGFRPRRWNYAVLPQTSVVEMEVLEVDKRPVRVEAGPQTTHNITHVKIWQDRSSSVTLLFDPNEHLGERIVREQFMA